MIQRKRKKLPKVSPEIGTRRALDSFRVDGLLSFAPGTPALKLGDITVLIGPNGAGKSNFIECLALLRETTRDFQHTFATGGGYRAWRWESLRRGSAHSALEAVAYLNGDANEIRHRIEFRDAIQRAQLHDEVIERISPAGAVRRKSETLFAIPNDQPTIRKDGKLRPIETFDRERSILVQRRDADAYPEITALASLYEHIAIYRDWTFGKNCPARLPQRVDLPRERILADGSNVAMVLNRALGEPDVMLRLYAAMRELLPSFVALGTRVEGGTILVELVERERVTLATRMSDGTLRFLALALILEDSSPPPLVVIEEPELGLHPDAIPIVGKMLVSASTRTQVIVTTHSDILVDMFSDTPDNVVVVERQEGATEMRRLAPDALAAWVNKYSLGQAWLKGKLGGTRW